MKENRFKTSDPEAMLGMYLAGAVTTLVYNRLMMMVSTGTLNKMRKVMFLHM